MNPSKTWLVVKESHLEFAKTIFSDSGVHITTDGRIYLGSFIGSYDMKYSFVQTKVKSCITGLGELTLVINTQPHAAFCGFTHGILNCQILTTHVFGILGLGRCHPYFKETASWKAPLCRKKPKLINWQNAKLARGALQLGLSHC